VRSDYSILSARPLQVHLTGNERSRLRTRYRSSGPAFSVRIRSRCGWPTNFWHTIRIVRPSSGCSRRRRCLIWLPRSIGR